MKNRKRSVLLQLYVSKQEKQLIDRRVKISSENSFSSYARRMLLDGYLIKPDWSDLAGMHRQIAGIATNINQIAHQVNATHSVYRTDMEQLQSMLSEIQTRMRFYMRTMEKLDRVMDE